MVMAEKHYTHKSISLDARDWEIIGKLSQRTHISRAHFVREALRNIVIKYKGLLADDPNLDLTAYEAAPAHAELLRQQRSNKDTIQPHEHVVSPVESDNVAEDPAGTRRFWPKEEPPPADPPPPPMPWSVR